MKNMTDWRLEVDLRKLNAHYTNVDGRHKTEYDHKNLIRDIKVENCL